jgi:hypothetical protein
MDDSHDDRKNSAETTRTRSDDVHLDYGFGTEHSVDKGGIVGWHQDQQLAKGSALENTLSAKDSHANGQILVTARPHRLYA